MSVNITCDNFPLSARAVDALWSSVTKLQSQPDSIVNIRCVSSPEIQWLNKRYRQVNEATNALTFSYGHEHDIALCLSVIQQESVKQNYPLKDYVAHVVTHAFLHAAGLDHVRQRDKEEMRASETAILAQNKFQPVVW